MARPQKNNCEYFPHDADMRNHRKIKAIRSRFGIVGYAIWGMLLESLTSGDGNTFEMSDMELELMAGDFGCDKMELQGVINFCVSLELLFEKNGFIFSESLNERLEPVYKKRGKSRELSRKQLRDNGKYVTETPQEPELRIAETPQSKVKYSKVNKIKVNEIKTNTAAYAVQYLEFISFLNFSLGKNYKGCKKSRDAFIARLKDGFTLDEIKTAISHGALTKFHVENNFNHLTPEFFTRPDKIEKFKNSKPIEEKKQETAQNTDTKKMNYGSIDKFKKDLSTSDNTEGK